MFLVLLISYSQCPLIIGKKIDTNISHTVHLVQPKNRERSGKKTTRCD